MSPSTSDRMAGAILLLIAAIWIVGVFWTIPEVADGARVGPRGFPLAMGVLLAVLASMLIVSGSLNASPAAATGEKPDGGAEIWALAATFGFLGGYVMLMAWLSFLVGTVIATALFLIFVLHKRSPKVIAAMSLGLALAVWLILGKAMGVYLPRGSLIDWF